MSITNQHPYLAQLLGIPLFLSIGIPNQKRYRLKSMSTLAERLQELVKEKPNYRQKALADACFIKPPSVADWFKGKTKNLEGANLQRAADYFGVMPLWLAEGKLPKYRPQTQRLSPPSIVSEAPPPHYLRNTEVAPAIDRQGLVPLISWIAAGSWSTVEDPYSTGDAEEWLPCPVRHGSRTYCLRVRGESMNNPDGKPSYDDGDIIYVDPDQEAVSGNRIITRLDDASEATFKQLVEEDGKRLLKALNPAWSPRYLELNVDATYCGKVIGKWVPE
jgi:SOS-response transcriptional repressor LexA